jgi:hypothetical protein
VRTIVNNEGPCSGVPAGQGHFRGCALGGIRTPNLLIRRTRQPPNRPAEMRADLRIQWSVTLIIWCLLGAPRGQVAATPGGSARRVDVSDEPPDGEDQDECKSDPDPGLVLVAGWDSCRDHGRFVQPLAAESEARAPRRSAAFQVREVALGFGLAVVVIMLGLAMGLLARVGWRHGWSQSRRMLSSGPHPLIESEDLMTVRGGPLIDGTGGVVDVLVWLGKGDQFPSEVTRAVANLACSPGVRCRSPRVSLPRQGMDQRPGCPGTPLPGIAGQWLVSQHKYGGCVQGLTGSSWCGIRPVPGARPPRSVRAGRRPRHPCGQASSRGHVAPVDARRTAKGPEGLAGGLAWSGRAVARSLAGRGGQPAGRPLPPTVGRRSEGPGPSEVAKASGPPRPPPGC